MWMKKIALSRNCRLLQAIADSFSGNMSSHLPNSPSKPDSAALVTAGTDITMGSVLNQNSNCLFAVQHTLLVSLKNRDIQCSCSQLHPHHVRTKAGFD